MNRFYSIIALLLIVLSANAQLISRQEACADIDSLVYTLNEVHPDMYRNISAGAFCLSMSKVRNGLTDSVEVTELYRQLAPVVAMMGDAHTGIKIPRKKIMDRQHLFMPVYPTIDNNTGRMYVKASADNCVPYDSEIISINDVSAADIIDAMKAYVCGEREFYKLTLVDNHVVVLFHFLFSAKEYKMVYRLPDSDKLSTITLKPVDDETLESKLVISPKLQKQMESEQDDAPYSYRILDDQPVAVLSFNSCRDAQKMKVFADSMFQELQVKGIRDLIIDVRHNGGGDSKCGDVLLRYISPKPFQQFGQTYMRVSTVTAQLCKGRGYQPGIYFYPEDSTRLKQPYPAPQHYDGRVYLLVSHHTFSSASSFAWAFKHFGCGTVIGEESGGMNVHFGDVVSYQLPNSKLRCGIAHKIFWQPGAKNDSVHGVLPDITVNQLDALDKALEIISKK